MRPTKPPNAASPIRQLVPTSTLTGFLDRALLWPISRDGNTADEAAYTLGRIRDLLAGFGVVEVEAIGYVGAFDAG